MQLERKLRPYDHSARRTSNVEMDHEEHAHEFIGMMAHANVEEDILWLK